jgi:hypothetical protein
MHGPAMLARACPEPLFSAMPFVDEAQLRVMLEVAISCNIVNDIFCNLNFDNFLWTWMQHDATKDM